PPSLEFHSDNCFSQTVNFDAIAKWTASQNGRSFLPEKFGSVRFCGFLNPIGGTSFDQTVRAFHEAREVFGPDDVFTLLAWLNAHMEEMTVPQVLSVLRLTRWDPIALMRLFPVLSRLLASAGPHRDDLHVAVQRTWQNHFPVASTDNALAFQCGA